MLSEPIGSREGADSHVNTVVSGPHCVRCIPSIRVKRRIPYWNEKWIYPLADTTQFASVRKTSVPARLRATR